MNNFQIGETIIINIEVRDNNGAYKSPATSMKIEIKQIKPGSKIVLASTNMVPDGEGKYHYDFATAGNEVGRYEVKYTATDSERITIKRDTFQLE